LFRLLYFGAILPNAYIAKGGPTLESLRDLLLLQPHTVAKLGFLIQSVVGWRTGIWILLALVLGVIWLAKRGTLSALHVVLFVLTVISVVNFLLLPDDWMGEYRFATPFFPFFYLLLASIVRAVADHARSLPSRRTLASVMVFVCVGTLAMAVRRTADFAQGPPIPIAEVVDTSRRFERLGEILGLKDPSLMIPEVGGALLYSKMRIYDLGMLCDRSIAETLGEGCRTRNQQSFYDYVFEVAQPDFLATRAYHSWIAHLDGDPRFRRDYVPIVEYQDEWVRKRYGVERTSGDFVRRELLPASPGILDRLRSEVKGTHYVGCSDCD
jgi:hypothetical protein